MILQRRYSVLNLNYSVLKLSGEPKWRSISGSDVRSRSTTCTLKLLHVVSSLPISVQRFVESKRIKTLLEITAHSLSAKIIDAAFTFGAIPKCMGWECFRTTENLDSRGLWRSGCRKLGSCAAVSAAMIISPRGGLPSALLPQPSTPPGSGNSSGSDQATPVFITHGNSDAVVARRDVIATCSFLRANCPGG